MVLPFSKYILSQNPFLTKLYPFQSILNALIHFHHFNPFSHKFSTFSSNHCERLSWERSTQEILLQKLKFSLRNHQSQEALETFHDFRRLYGYPEVQLLNQVIVHLCYSSNHVLVRKSFDLSLKIVQENSQFALFLARMQMSSPVSVILRLMLEKGFVSSMQFLPLIVFHIVETETGTHLVSNYLSRDCDFYNCLKDKKAQDTLVFNLVLDACVRFKLALKGLCLMELML